MIVCDCVCERDCAGVSLCLCVVVVVFVFVRVRVFVVGRMCLCVFRVFVRL